MEITTNYMTLWLSVETSDHKMWSLVWSQLCDHTMWVWSQGSVWSLQDRVNHTAFQACISILGIVINLCSGAPEFCLTVVSETAEKCFLTGGSQAVDVITRKCDHKCDHLVITRSHLWSHDHICDHSSDPNTALESVHYKTKKSESSMFLCK